MEMNPRQQQFAIFMAAALLVVIVELVRRRRLKIEYSWLWLFTGAAILILVLRYEALIWFTDLIGAVLPTTTLFIFAFFFLILLMLHFSVKTTAYDEQIKKLAQELALLRNKVEEGGIITDEKGKTKESGDEG
ncbi:MAG: hypothetical protein Kow0090_02290 [Myxococcota bacterium]